MTIRPLTRDRTIAFYPGILGEADREHERGLGPQRDPRAPADRRAAEVLPIVPEPGEEVE